MQKLLSLDGIKTERGDFCYLSFEWNGAKKTAQINKITTEIDKLYDIEGKLPENKNEIAVIKTFAENHDLKIGDEIAGFTVTAFVMHPEYLTKNESRYGVSFLTSVPLNVIFFSSDDYFTDPDIFSLPCMLVSFDAMRSVEMDVPQYDTRRLMYEEELNEICGDNGVSVISRNLNFGQLTRKDNFEGLFRKMRLSMALPFLIISLFVCYTVVKRIILSDAKLIGTKKALGYKNSEIVRFYLCYSGTAVIIGFVLGIICGIAIMEYVILKVLQGIYAFTEIYRYFSIVETLILFAVIVIMIGGVTWLSVNKTLKSKTLDLLNDVKNTGTKKHFFETGRLWNRLSLLTKTVINNMINNRSRVFSMMVGIIGSTLLLAAGLNLFVNIKSSLDRQFDEIQTFDTVLYFDPDADGCRERIEELLKENHLQGSAFYSLSGYISLNSSDIGTLIFAADNGDFCGFVNVYDESGKLQEIEDGVWINGNLKDHQHLNIGDTVTFSDSRKTEYALPLAGGMEHYLIVPQILMSTQTFSEIFGTEPEENVFFVRLDSMNFDDFSELFFRIDGATSIEDYYSSQKSTFDSFARLCNLSAIIFIVLSFAMAFVVILNLLDMYISEKKNELIVLRINGYSVEKAKKYIYLDTVFLSVIGIAAGIAGGVLLSRFCVISLTTEATCFLNRADPVALSVSAAVSSLMMLVISLVSLRKIKGFQLSDIGG